MFSPVYTVMPARAGMVSSGNLVQEDTFLSSRCSHTYCGPIAITGMIGLCFVFNELEDPWTSLASFRQISVSVCFEAVTSPSLYHRSTFQATP